MFFNSFDFAIFLPIVFFFYWFSANRSLRFQNVVVVVASYSFYGWWDWRFLFLIFFSSVVDYLVGIGLAKHENHFKRKILLWTSITVNLGLLGFFKYYNFFLDNFVTVFSVFGIEIKPNSLNIVLPVGISFYTFQTMSYSIDVYKRKFKPTKDFLAFLAFVSFFPQLVAGPIERASNLLPQFCKIRLFDYSKAIDGLRQILWGLFKKIVIADNCAEYVDAIFNNSASYPSNILILGAIFFAIQIYCDFSGYSDIAIGVSRLFGIELMQNFNFPYFSRNIGEFWRRWHISLSTWFRDYLYIPMGGNRRGVWMTVRNTFVVFVVAGFWHGANWTFIVWGFFNAIYFLPHLLWGKKSPKEKAVANGKMFPAIRELVSICITFVMTVFAWIFFRAENITHALQYVSGIFSKPITLIQLEGYKDYKFIIFLVIIFLIVEWLARDSKHALEKISQSFSRPLRHGVYCLIIISLILLGGQEQQFIYFQF